MKKAFICVKCNIVILFNLRDEQVVFCQHYPKEPNFDTIFSSFMK